MTKERLEALKDTNNSIQLIIQQAHTIPDLKQRYCWLVLAESMQNELLKELEMEVKHLNK